jgi:ferrochelatase
MSQLDRDIAILVMAMGGPSTVEEVEDFLSRFLGSRVLSSERIEAIKERYRLIGGGSPLREITLRQTEALQAELARMGHRCRVSAAMRFSEPTVEDAVAHMKARGTRRLVALPLALFRSKLSTEPYFAALDRAMTDQRASFEVSRVTGWHIHPLFLDALEEKIREGFSRFTPSKGQAVGVIFSAHSLPEGAVADDPYVDEIHETIRGLRGRLGPLTWRLAFQSRGRGSEPWLAPDLGEVIGELSRTGLARVLVVPLGFVSDHLETLYDLDIQGRKQAECLGLTYGRSPSLNDSPKFIQALARIVLENLEIGVAPGG